jgi:peptidyl-prolyl cis-trans isomerase C
MITESGTSRRAFIEQLGSRGLSERDILDEIKFEQANSQLFTLATKDVKPATDAAAKSYYAAHAAELASPEYRTLLNIVVPSKEQAENVVRLARSGVPFGRLVERYSIDESTRGKGGALGTLTADQLESGYAREAFAAAEGGFFGPVQTPQGWNVGRVTAVEASEPTSYDRVKDALKARLSYEAKLKAWNAFLTDQVKAADLVYADDYQPADPDQLPSPAIGQTSPSAR